MTSADTPATRPLVVPRTEAQQVGDVQRRLARVGDVDPHELDSAAWHDPSLSSAGHFNYSQFAVFRHCKLC